MKKQNIFTLLTTACICLFAVSCLDDEDLDCCTQPADSFSSLADFTEAIKPEAQTFSIDPTQEQTVTGDQGTVIQIGTDNFTDENDDPITTPIEVELKEYLTPLAMFAGNVQTESNGQLLITGGSFDLQFKDQDGNEVTSNPWGVQSQIPVQTDITGYENDMQYFTGETTTVNGQEVVNWEVNGQVEAWMDENNVFNTLGIEQGLSNCDVLYDMAGETATQFEVMVQDVADYSNTAVWMFVDDFPSVINIYSLNTAEDALTTYAGSIPVGLNATLVAITIDESNYLKFGSLPITVAGDDVFTVATDYGTTAELAQLLNTITQ